MSLLEVKGLLRPGLLKNCRENENERKLMRRKDFHGFKKRCNNGLLKKQVSCGGLDQRRPEAEGPLHGLEVVLPPAHFGVVDLFLGNVGLFHFHSRVLGALPNFDHHVRVVSGRPTFEPPLLDDLGEGDNLDEDAADVAAEHLEGLALGRLLHLDFAGGKNLKHFLLSHGVEKFLP